MNIDQKFIERIIQLIDLSKSAQENKFISFEDFAEFKSSALSLIKSIYGVNHPYYLQFDQNVRNALDPSPYDYRFIDVLKGRGILQSIKTELENGWLTSLKGLVSAEIFADFLEMAEHLLKEKYKDASAVMIGSVLEEHLRQICNKHGIPIENFKDEKPFPKKADSLNSDLGNAGIYNKLDQKSVISWLDLRNKAAHGKYEEYNQQQVELMLQGVTEFMIRNAI